MFDVEGVSSGDNVSTNQVEIFVQSRNSSNYEITSFVLDQNEDGSFDQFISEFSGEATAQGTGATATIYGEGVDATDTRDLDVDYVLFDNDTSAIIAAGSSTEGHNVIGIAFASSLSENAVNEGVDSTSL